MSLSLAFRRKASCVAVALTLGGCLRGQSLPDTPFVAAVVEFTPGANAGFGQDKLPNVVMGPPVGAGSLRGSTDVVSLGIGGEIVVELGREIIDGEGDDLIVFENPFYIGGNHAAAFIELGIVGVSDDGVHFTDFACDRTTHVGCAGVNPVYANGSVTGDPNVDGGDGFDLATVGITRARFVRVVDAGGEAGQAAVAPMAGFDLDAVYAIHSEKE